MAPLGDLGSTLFGELRERVFNLPRYKYSLDMLGPPTFKLGGNHFRRCDVEIQNSRGQILQCSHFQQVDGSKRPCVVYCHGTGSSRVECVYILRAVLTSGISVFCFDFAGCGLSDGEHTSFGYHEYQDLRSVVQYLRASDLVSSIGLWGRSMGAVAVAMMASNDQSIAACVLDSPYCSLQQLATELVLQWSIVVPDFILKLVFRLIASEMEAQMGFRVEDLEILLQVKHAAVPAIFAGATDDKLIQKHHVEDLYDAWGGADGKRCGVERRLLHFSGGHNGARPRWFIRESVGFLRSHLEQPAVVRTWFGRPRWLESPLRSYRKTLRVEHGVRNGTCEPNGVDE